ncbi:MAG: tripartite tricarboxylate transporter substrate binding protein [Variovorax sp.]|nr:MAG: tripartite tricarboxylate transporter substrate binding protein [Variovorax sp.]
MQRLIRTALLALFFVAALPVAFADTLPYPVKPIRMLVPFPAGGSTDPVARLVAQKLNEAWGQAVVVDNRPGANTIIGTDALAKSPPDGYTILLTASTHVINSLLMSKLPYDSYKDFIPAATLYKSEFLLVLHPSVQANTLQELIALAKAKPGAINYAISGSGNANQLAGELFNMVAGVKLTSVPYKGGGPAINDLLGGQVQAMFSVPVSVIGQVKAGKLRAIAYTGETALAALPQVPTFAQAGLPDFDMKSWCGILVPAGTPKAIVDKLSTEIAKILAMPDVRAKLEDQGQIPFIQNTEQFTALMSADREKFGKIIRTANITAE